MISSVTFILAKLVILYLAYLGALLILEDFSVSQSEGKSE